jgi:hypothetical protein
MICMNGLLRHCFLTTAKSDPYGRANLSLRRFPTTAEVMVYPWENKGGPVAQRQKRLGAPDLDIVFDQLSSK